jgi:hypothetical protein
MVTANTVRGPATAAMMGEFSERAAMHQNAEELTVTFPNWKSPF